MVYILIYFILNIFKLKKVKMKFVKFLSTQSHPKMQGDSVVK